VIEIGSDEDRKPDLLHWAIVRRLALFQFDLEQSGEGTG
jgi:hypothetical protein